MLKVSGVSVDRVYGTPKLTSEGMRGIYYHDFVTELAYFITLENYSVLHLVVCWAVACNVSLAEHG